MSLTTTANPGEQMDRPVTGLRIDLGCGAAKKEGTIGLDIQGGPGVDHVVDIEKQQWPFADETVSYVHSSHFLEHIQDPTLIFAEMSRVCADQANLELWTPYAWSNSAFIIDHKMFYTEDIYVHMCVWFVDFWEKILKARWVLNEFHYVVDASTLCYLKANNISLDFALRHMQNIVTEFCARITVLRNNLNAPAPPVRRTFSTGRTTTRFEVKADQLARPIEAPMGAASNEPTDEKIQDAIRSFANGGPLPSLPR